MFEVGKEYKRKEDIHDIYGGQRQGGISTPQNHPFLFIFTSESGGQHGYHDEYRDDGIFWYTGEGQIGDMKMAAGNKAIFEHSENKKIIHVFEHTRKAYVRYIGSAECLGYHKEVRPDRLGNDRSAFVFHIDIDSIQNINKVAEPKHPYGPQKEKELKRKDIKDLREAALTPPPQNSTKKEKREIAYYRSQALKLYVIARAKGLCEGCGGRAPFHTKDGPFLECHHVHRLADGGPDHPKNVVALCPNCHRRAHFSKDAATYNERLKAVAVNAEQNVA